MQIKIKITNALTGKVEVDNTIEVDSTFEVMQANHACMADAFPDCFVNFFADDSSFICSQPRNMIKDEIAYDEGRMTWEEYCNKWYKGVYSGCNEDDHDGISDAEAEYQVDSFLENQFNSYDSIIY